MAKYYGTDGDDTITGTVANDVFFASKGTDRLNGGSGPDEISFDTWGRAVSIDLALTTFQSIGPGSKVKLTSFEAVIGSRYSDYLYGNAADNVMYGGKGGDVVYGRDGQDFLSGDEGDDLLVGGTGNDTLIGAAGDDRLIGGSGNDVLSGGAGTDVANYVFETAGITLDLRISGQQYVGASAGSDTLVSIENVAGSDYADVIVGNDADNILYGNGGDNVLEGGAGDDQLVGGSEVDTASYEHATAGVTVSLVDTGVQDTTGAGHDQLFSIENVRGSAYTDVFNGNGAGNGFDGGGGVDWVAFSLATHGMTVNLANGTSSSSDTFTSIENIIGTMYNDGIYGNDGDNALYGQEGDDVLRGRLGTDTLSGGSGSDWVYYDTAASAVTVALYITGAQNTGGEGTDTLQSIENLVGSDGDDTLSGNASVNALFGSSGTDTLDGREGNDYLNGGSDADILTGGAGADTFGYGSVGESVPGFLEGDFIQDFSRAQHDIISLTGIDARTDVAGNDAFTFIGNAAFSGVSGQLRFDYTSATNQYVVSGDVNGDKVADFSIYVTSDSAAPVSTDFGL